ncbi:MAG: DegT/DnrJ/EryC1/StrS family aminotransferase, partial [Candidatus Nealsonbacteria bacterium]|nr:DegT/DnrJ/EryC1/StrS family aminotransferase [Candidatus Nealsonbacteria bacterium]
MILFYTSIPRSFRTTLIGHLYKLASEYPVVLLSEDLDEFTEEIVKNKKLFPKLEAIIPVHLCGHPAEMNKIMMIAKKYNLFVIEDSAQAIGAIYNNRYTGTMGDCGVFSFNQSKHINTGEGGLLITNDDLIARRVKAVRNHGEVSDPDLKLVGYNYRLCEIEASLALEQLYNLDSMTDIRIKLADRMTQRLSEIPGFTPPVTYPDCKHVFYTYAVKYDESMTGLSRDEFQDK